MGCIYWALFAYGKRIQHGYAPYLVHTRTPPHPLITQTKAKTVGCRVVQACMCTVYSPHSKLAASTWLAYTTYFWSIVFCLCSFIMMKVIHTHILSAIAYENLLENKKNKKMSHSKLAAPPTPTIMLKTPSLRICNQEPLFAVRSQVQGSVNFWVALCL